MADHPLVSSEVRTYMEKNEIEHHLNKALNHVLTDLPQDPLSSMAVKLLESTESSPTVAKLVTNEAFLCDLS